MYRQKKEAELEEVRIAIACLKNNKTAGADGLTAELFKYGGEELIKCMHQILCRIWLYESISHDGNQFCPIHNHQLLKFDVN